MFAEAVITAGAFATIFAGLGPKWLRRMVGYHLPINIALHAGVLWLFFGTAGYALIQAEAAAIMLTGSLFVFRKLFGYERLVRVDRRVRWVRFNGLLSRVTK